MLNLMIKYFEKLYDEDLRLWVIQNLIIRYKFLNLSWKISKK